MGLIDPIGIQEEGTDCSALHSAAGKTGRKGEEREGYGRDS